MRRAMLVLAMAGCVSEVGLRGAVDGPGLDEASEPIGSAEDVFLGSEGDPTDVLFVVDNSPSMWDHQRKLSRNLTRFLDVFVPATSEFRIAVIATDLDDPVHGGRLRRTDEDDAWLDRDTDALEDRFRQLVELGDDGSVVEQGRAAVLAALDPDGPNAGFHLPDRHLHIVVLSDEPDKSDGLPDEVFLDALVDLQEPPWRLLFSSIVGIPDAQWVPRRRCSFVPSLDYVRISARLGGVSASICDDDWGAMLAAIGEQLLTPRTELFLTRDAVPDSIDVTIELDGEPLGWEGANRGWLFDESTNAVRIFNYRPPARALIRIRYEPSH
ncbi:MAG: hypothetical protein AAF602_19550 [Myxococcota bacterium]